MAKKALSKGEDKVYIALMHPSIPEPIDDEGFWIHFLDFSTGETTPVVPTTKDPDKYQNSRLSVSPDGQSILFTLEEDTSDLMLVENFR